MNDRETNDDYQKLGFRPGEFDLCLNEWYYCDKANYVCEFFYSGRSSTRLCSTMENYAPCMCSSSFTS